MVSQNHFITNGTLTAELYPWFAPDLPAIERAILLSLAYADVFEFPLTTSELHRYLAGFQTTAEQLNLTLNDPPNINELITRVNGYYTLKGREYLVESRDQRAALVKQLQPKAHAYGYSIAKLPYVRMVGLTGALAVGNVGAYPDFDYLIVTEPKYLWICRLWVIALVRLAALKNDILCPNYFISTRALIFKEQDFYTAHELTQMVPIAGHNIYQKMRALNVWSQRYLPNAGGPPVQVNHHNRNTPTLRAAAEGLFRNPFGEWLEDWEMNRKLIKFTGLAASQPESSFSPDLCKGHFDEHGQKSLKQFQERLETLQGHLR